VQQRAGAVAPLDPQQCGLLGEQLVRQALEVRRGVASLQRGGQQSQAFFGLGHARANGGHRVFGRAQHRLLPLAALVADRQHHRRHQHRADHQCCERGEDPGATVHVRGGLQRGIARAGRRTGRESIICQQWLGRDYGKLQDSRFRYPSGSLAPT